MSPVTYNLSLMPAATDLQPAKSTTMDIIIWFAKTQYRKLWCKHYFLETQFKTKTNFGVSNMFLTPN